MKNLIITICFLLSCSLYSQNDLQTVFPVNDEKTNFVKYEFLLADQVALRSKPSLSGEILSRLEIGSRLFLIERSDEMMVQNGIKSHWYKVVVNEKTGWVWGGLIAMQSFDSSTDASLKFVAGYEKSRYNAERERYDCQYQVRAVRENKQVDKITINATVGVDKIESLGKKGLEKVDDILKLKSICDAYDCIMEVVYLFWSQDKFIKVFKLSETLDEDQEGMHNIETLSFPSDSDGIAKTIVKTTKELEFVEIENDETEIYLNTRKDFFIWDGAKILPDERASESTTVNEEGESMGPEKLKLSFSSISESEFLNFKNNYDDKILFDSSKVEQPGSSFFLETALGNQDFSCTENYDPSCYYYDGYLEPLQLYLLTEGHIYYAQAFALSRKDGKRFPFYSPFDSAANSVLISKEEDQLLTFGISVYDRASFIGRYQIGPEENDFSISEFSAFQTDKWNIDELVWIDKNNFALKVYEEEECCDQENKSILRGVKYLKARIVN